MMQKNHPHKKVVLLLVCLGNNPFRNLRECVYVWLKEGKIKNLEERSDVTWLSDNAILFDNTTAPDIQKQFCSNLDGTDLPYLLARMDSTSVRVCGTFSKGVEATLKAYEIPLIITS